MSVILARLTVKAVNEMHYVVISWIILGLRREDSDILASERKC